MWSLVVFLGCLFLAYLIAASVFIGLGIAVLLQWPKPHIFCFTQPFSDAPQDLACFGLNKIHFVFTVAWAGLIALFSVRLRVALMAICCVMAVAHLLLAVVLRQKVLSSPLFAGYPSPQGDADAVAVGVPVQMPQAGSWPASQPAPGDNTWPAASSVPSVPVVASGVPSVPVFASGTASVATARAMPSVGVAMPLYAVPSAHAALHAPPSPLADPAARAAQRQPGSAPL